MCLHCKTINPRINRRQIPECVWSCLVSAVSVPTERATPPSPWAMSILWEGKSPSCLPSSPPSFLPSFPTDNCRWQPLRLGCIDFGNCLLQIRKATMSWGYSKQGLWGFFPLWAYPKDIDFCCCSPYKERLSLLHQNPSFTKLWYSDLMLRAVGLGSAPAPSWLFPI